MQWMLTKSFWKRSLCKSSKFGPQNASSTGKTSIKIRKKTWISFWLSTIRKWKQSGRNKNGWVWLTQARSQSDRSPPMTRCCLGLHNSNCQVRSDLKAVPAGKVASLALNKDPVQAPKLVPEPALVLSHVLDQQLRCQLASSLVTVKLKTKIPQLKASLHTKLASNACTKMPARAKPSQMTRIMMTS